MHPRKPLRRPLPPFPSLPEALAGAARVAVVGVGSDLRGDDAAGVRVAQRLAAWCARHGPGRLAAFAAGSAPENFTGPIVAFRPDLAVLVDAAHLGRGPGAVEVIPPERVAGTSFSTHMLPATIFLDYLAARCRCRTLVIGIDIAQKELLSGCSPAVERAVRRLVTAFQRHFGAGGQG